MPSAQTPYYGLGAYLRLRASSPNFFLLAIASGFERSHLRRQMS
jgi:hypothetical protein